MSECCDLMGRTGRWHSMSCPVAEAEDAAVTTEQPEIKREVTTYTERRRARVYLSESDLHAFLGLPQDLRIVATSTDFRMCSVALLVEGEGLEPLPEFAEPPEISGRTVREVVEVGGQLYWRLAWEPVG